MVANLKFMTGQLLKQYSRYDIPDMYLCEDRAFVESTKTGEKNKGYISNIIETAKLLDALYESADKKSEVEL